MNRRLWLGLAVIGALTWVTAFVAWGLRWYCAAGLALAMMLSYGVLNFRPRRVRRQEGDGLRSIGKVVLQTLVIEGVVVAGYLWAWSDALAAGCKSLGQVVGFALLFGLVFCLDALLGCFRALR